MPGCLIEEIWYSFIQKKNSLTDAAYKKSSNTSHKLDLSSKEESATQVCQRCHTCDMSSQHQVWLQTTKSWSHTWLANTKDATALRQFLGLVSYYGRHIHNFADIAAPLNTLTQKATPFTWSHECDKTFTTLKYRLTKAPVLAYTCFSTNSDQFTVHTDASGVGLGAVLEQVAT